MGFVHHTTAAGMVTGWMEQSRLSPGKALPESVSPTATGLTCTPISTTPASGGASLVRQHVNLIPQTRLSRDTGRRA